MPHAHVCEACLRAIRPGDRCRRHPWAPALHLARPADRAWADTLAARRRERRLDRARQLGLGVAAGIGLFVAWAVVGRFGGGRDSTQLHAGVLVALATLGGLTGLVAAAREATGGARALLRQRGRPRGAEPLLATVRRARRAGLLTLLAPVTLYPVLVACSLVGVLFLLDDAALFRAWNGYWLEDHLGFALAQAFFATVAVVAGLRAWAAARSAPGVDDALAPAQPRRLTHDDLLDAWAEEVAWARPGGAEAPAVPQAQRVIR